MEKLKDLFINHYVIPQEWLWAIFGVVCALAAVFRPVFV